MNRIIKALTIILVTAIALISIYPLLVYGKNAALYNVDPDVVYVANALSEIESKQIFFAKHPGTPTISLLTISYFPIRVITKVLLHQNFIDWSFDNLQILLFYSRFVMFLMFYVSLLVLLKAFLFKSKNKLTAFFMVLALIPAPDFFRLGAIVAPETLSIFFVATWVLIFNYFDEKRTLVTYLGLCAISGLAFANKYNNAFLVVSSAPLIFFVKNFNIKQKIIGVFIGSVAIFTAFYAAIFPVRGYFFTMVQSFLGFLIRSGPHGGGGISILDIPQYLNAIGSFARSNLAITFITLAAMALIAYSVKIKKLRLTSPVNIAFALTLLCNVFLLKYSLRYYLLPGYVLMAFLFSRILIKHNFRLTLVISLVLLGFAFFPIQKYLKSTSFDMDQTLELERYTSDIKGKTVLWDYAPTSDFARVWMRAWGGGFFNDQLKAKRPELLELEADYKTVNLEYMKQVNIFEVCWDELLIREERAREFLEIYKSRNLTYVPIGETGIGSIHSNYCKPRAP